MEFNMTLLPHAPDQDSRSMLYQSISSVLVNHNCSKHREFSDRVCRFAANHLADTHCCHHGHIVFINFQQLVSDMDLVYQN